LAAVSGDYYLAGYAWLLAEYGAGDDDEKLL